MSKIAGVLVALVSLGLAPFVIRASGSFYLTYKYEEIVRQRLSPTIPLDRLQIPRREVDMMMKPLRSREVREDLPLIFGEDEAIQRGYAVGYYLLHPDLSGCQLYFVFEGSDDSSVLVGYRDACE